MSDNNDPDAEAIERIRRTAPPAADVSAMGFMPALIKMAFAVVREREVAPLKAVLKHYEDSFCEGFCKDVPAGFTSPDMELDCSGCKARAAIASRAAV